MFRKTEYKVRKKKRNTRNKSKHGGIGNNASVGYA